MKHVHRWAMASTATSLLLHAGCGGASPAPDPDPIAEEAHDGHPAASAGGHAVHEHHFDDPARFAQQWNSPDRDAWQQPDSVIDALAIAPGMTVADLGTGTGYFVPFLSSAVGPEGRVLALDVEQAMVDWVGEAAQEHAWENVDAIRIGTEGPGVDGVDRFLVVNVWHHLSDRENYADALRNALAPGGHIVVVEYDMVAEPGPPMSMRLTPEQVIADFAAAGFDATVADVALPRQYMVIAVPR